MKKTILVVMVLAAGCALRAQEAVVYTVRAPGSDNTYLVAEPLHTNFRTDHPGVTLRAWEPVSGWWYSTYKEENNRITYLYYSTQPYYLVPVPGRDVNYKVALPVSNSYIPETVIALAIDRYGTSLYSITTIMGNNNEMVYQVGLLENGNLRTVWMNPEPTVFTSFDKMKAGELRDKRDEEKQD
jgi:hypothetical protein